MVTDLEWANTIQPFPRLTHEVEQFGLPVAIDPVGACPLETIAVCGFCCGTVGTLTTGTAAAC